MGGKNRIIIVSGLPRSGTSMMMRMLNAGGIEILTDNIRTADEDNPRGYYEFEQVKKVGEDASWLDGSEGKAVKMVSMLLYDLPSDREYLVVFMRREMEEILASQRKMLERKGEGASVDYAAMGRAFERHLGEIEAWLSQRPNFRVVYVKYNDLVKDTAAALRPLNDLLGGRLKVDEMVKVVDESLYRQRGTGSVAPTGAAVLANEQAKDEDEQRKMIEQLKSLGYME